MSAPDKREARHPGESDGPEPLGSSELPATVTPRADTTREPRRRVVVELPMPDNTGADAVLTYAAFLDASGRLLPARVGDLLHDLADQIAAGGTPAGRDALAAADADRLAAAWERITAERARDETAAVSYVNRFGRHWTAAAREAGVPGELPSDWRASVRRLHAAGLPFPVLREHATTALGAAGVRSPFRLTMHRAGREVAQLRARTEDVAGWSAWE